MWERSKKKRQKRKQKRISKTANAIDRKEKKDIEKIRNGGGKEIKICRKGKEKDARICRRGGEKSSELCAVPSRRKIIGKLHQQKGRRISVVWRKRKRERLKKAKMATVEGRWNKRIR
jgi:hypothetical protein